MDQTETVLSDNVGIQEYHEKLIDDVFDRLANIRNEVAAAHADETPY